ncbi:MAG: rhomboid family intramembrane serine protease [Candidatus Woesearchaeota archaeon]
MVKQAVYKRKRGFQLKNVTLKLLAINVFIFLVQVSVPRFTDMFALVASDVASRPWMLFSAMFLHGSFAHLLFNMYALFLFGSLIERKIGSKRFLLAYLISGIAASLIFALATPEGVAVGASGAIMAILGLVIMLMPDLQVLFFFVVPMSMRTAGIIFAIIDLVGFVSGSSGIAHIAHLAGLACGLAYGYYLKKKKKQFGRNFGNRGSQYRQSARRGPYYDNERTIELTKDDVDNYFKYGKL